MYVCVRALPGMVNSILVVVVVVEVGSYLSTKSSSDSRIIFCSAVENIFKQNHEKKENSLPIAILRTCMYVCMYVVGPG